MNIFRTWGNYFFSLEREKGGWQVSVGRFSDGPEYWTAEPSPLQDDDAHNGNITTPAGAQSGEVIDTTRAPYVPNLPCAISGDPS